MVFVALRRALVKASHQGFRVVHFSVQFDHVHLMVEKRATRTRSRAAPPALDSPIARAADRCFGRRRRFWADRYHARALRKPREVRDAMVYVFANWHRHVPPFARTRLTLLGLVVHPLGRRPHGDPRLSVG